MRIGIIGRGTLGGAIAHGLAESSSVQTLRSTTRATRNENVLLVEQSDVVMVCVKPRDMEDAVCSIAPSLAPHHIVISTAASVTSAEIRRWSSERGRIVRAMPNTPAQASEAMTVVARNEHSCDEAIDTACRLFREIGRAIVMDETQMDAVTAVSGCGPAFAFVVMEAMIDAALALGISYERAREMVGQTMLGSAKLMLQMQAHPAALKTAVATPGGRTIRGLLELESGGLRSALSRAVLAAARPPQE